MMFRRFPQRFRQQQWAAIATELVIVIIGVFIGMQVSNRNEEREANQKAAVFTARLIDDFRKEAWGYGWIIEYNHQTNTNQRRVLDAMAGEAALSDEQFVISAYRTTQFKENTRHRATYDELVSTGTIELIADRQLPETAAAIFMDSFLQPIPQQVRDSEYHKLFRATVSAETQEALLVRCGDRYAKELDWAAIKGSLDYPCTLGVPADKNRAAANALKTLPRLVPALQARFAGNQTALTDLQQKNSVVL